MGAEVTALGLAIWAVLMVPLPMLLAALIIAWLLQATALLAVPSPRDSTTLGMILAIFGLLLAFFGFSGEVEAHLLGFALGLLIAAVAWTGASDPQAKYLQAVTLFPPMGALLGAGSMGFALGIGFVFALLHAGISRALKREGEALAPPATSLAIGWAAGTWLLWLYGPGALFRPLFQ